MKLLQRYRFVLLGIVGAGLIAASVLTLRDGGGGDTTRGHLGPTPGAASAERYISEKRTYLGAIASTEPTQKAAALISFKNYVPAPGAQRILRGMEPTAVWVRFPGGEAEPVLVETTIAGAVADRAAALRKVLDAEVTELEHQVAGAQGAEREALVNVIAETKADLAKTNGDCGCVFAATVSDAELRELRDLWEQPAVRIVDVPDPPTNDLSGWELQPFVPREK